MTAFPELGPVIRLKDLYGLMDATRYARLVLVQSLLRGQKAEAEGVALLKDALDRLRLVPGPDGQAVRDFHAERSLQLTETRSVSVVLSYEIGELERDILFLEQGEQALLERIETEHPGVLDQAREVADTLDGLRFRTLISDRDGTVNNYCGRYGTSTQSAYNAVFLARFAGSRVDHPILLTSAPLDNGGIVDISTTPPGSFVFAASKGREFIGLDGEERRKPVPPGKQALLDKLNGRLKIMLGSPEYETFGLIGSGLQFKFGQTTVARQDMDGSVESEVSDAFLAKIRDLVAELDPKGEVFRIEDTGKDIEVLLTVDDTNGEGGARDFDKGDGVRFLAQELGLDMAQGPHLVCGDTGSDVPMLEAALDMCDHVYAVYVTQDEKLADRVKQVCAGAMIVDRPDALVVALNMLA